MPKLDASTLRALISAQKAKPMPAMDALRRMFEYDAGKLFWKERADVPAEWNVRWAGKEAKRITNGGKRFSVTIKGYGQLKLHRVIWKLFYGTEPEEIDHIDGNPLNNRIENLRAATRSENQINVPGWCRSGLKGAYFNKRRSHWYSQIWVDGKHRYLGSFGTPEEAHDAYVRASAPLHGEFAQASHRAA